MPGHLATHVSRVQGEDRTTVRIGVTFASAEEILRWERSAMRSQRLAEVDALTYGPPVALSVDDLERWGLTSRPQTPSPSRLRSAILIWIALFPPALLMNVLVMPGLDEWPVLANTLLLTLTLVPVVVFVTLPLLNRAVTARRAAAPSTGT
jgi:antibiotic biosynthesis monooxygenase (ABM) superfamily enzyme